MNLSKYSIQSVNQPAIYKYSNPIEGSRLLAHDIWIAIRGRSPSTVSDITTSNDIVITFFVYVHNSTYSRTSVRVLTCIRYNPTISYIFPNHHGYDKNT